MFCKSSRILSQQKQSKKNLFGCISNWVLANISWKAENDLNEVQGEFQLRTNPSQMLIDYDKIRYSNESVSYFIFYLIFLTLMGNQQPVPPLPRCSVCNFEKCKQCNRCSNCVPILNCNECLYKNPKNIQIKTGYNRIKYIYDNGIIFSARAYASSISSSRIPFSGGLLHHCLLQLRIQYDDVTRDKIVVDAERTSGYHGKMKVMISEGGANMILTNQIEIQNKSFKQFYDYLKENWHGKEYDRYENNCYDLVTKSLLFLRPKVDANQIQKINDHKSKQIKKFWD